MQSDTAPTSAEWILNLTPSQRRKFTALAEAWRSFKYEVTHEIRAEDIEPLLASPRSSLDSRAVEPYSDFVAQGTRRRMSDDGRALHLCGHYKVEGEKTCRICKRERQRARSASR